MTTRSYAMDGMTCGHCVHAVTAEVGKVPGVRQVTVDLDSGTVTVTGRASTTRRSAPRSTRPGTAWPADHQARLAMKQGHGE